MEKGASWMSYLVLTQKTVEEAVIYWVKKYAKMSGLEVTGDVSFVDYDRRKLPGVLVHVDLKEKK